MTAAARCPRCCAPLQPPGLMSSDFRCGTHGPVPPYASLGVDGLEQLAARATVPTWLPLPLLPGWSVTGLASAGDDRTGPVAVLTAFSGPSPLGGPADLLLVAEEPEVGLGATCAGVPGLDPGSAVTGPPDAKILVAGHPTPLWRCGSADDRVAFVGEGSGVWLFAVLWPPAAELLLLEHIALHDARTSDGVARTVPRGAASPRVP